MKTKRTIVLALTLLALAACNGDSNPVGLGSIDVGVGYTGTILDAANSQAVSGVRVDVGTTMLQSDASGRFAVYGLPKGTYTVTATKTGYTPYIGTVTIGTTNVDQKIFLSR